MLGKIAMGFLVVTAMGTAYICQDGFVNIRVEEYRKGGENHHLILPAQLAPLAAHFVPLRHLRNAERGLRDFLPALRAASTELAKIPDTLLVEARDHDEHVRISKSGDGLDIEVESPREHVHVWVPLRAIYDTADALASRLGTN